jgi:hypothetical protein
MKGLPFGYNCRVMVLSGWKEIAAHLRCGVRTAQRRVARGLPVRRVGNGPKAPVIADSELVDAWIRHGGRVRNYILETEATITNSKKQLAELIVSQTSLRRGLKTLREGIRDIREKGAALRQAREKQQYGWGSRDRQR